MFDTLLTINTFMTIAPMIITTIFFAWFLTPIAIYTFWKAWKAIIDHLTEWGFRVVEIKEDGSCVVYYYDTELPLQKPYPTGIYFLRLCRLNKVPYAIISSVPIQILTLQNETEYTLPFPHEPIYVAALETMSTP